MALVNLTPPDVTITGKSPTNVVAGYATLRAALATTTSYVATSHIAVAQAKRVDLRFSLVWVDSTSTEWYVEWSHDGTTFWRSTNVSPSGGTNTFTQNVNTFASGATAVWADSFEPEDLYMRVSVKKTGGVGADTLAVFCSVVGG